MDAVLAKDCNRKENTKKDYENVKLLYCGFLSGVLQAGIFNPWDRALYLSVAKSRPFLNAKNFKSPWTGVFQTLFQRGISSGLYFPLEEMFSRYLSFSFKDNPSYRPYLVTSAGFMAGAVNGLLLNPISSVKYHYWGTPELKNANFRSIAVDMLQRGGIRTFFVGSVATISRDVVFGGCFAFFRHQLIPVCANNSYDLSEYPQSKLFCINLAAGFIATTISSPFNYVRNIQYSVQPDVKADSTMTVLKDLWKDAAAKESTRLRLSHLQSRLRLGWGTARVGCGMALTAQFYSLIKQYT